MNIDFEKIRPNGGDDRYAFEELVCQLARRTPPPNTNEFRRIEGSGGDGGVEAYWLHNNGTKTGYQAKYHLSARDIDWSAIDESVQTALTKHPTLERYCIALACDLTDRSGVRGQGKTGWEHWEAHKAKWELLATNRGRAVSFEPWPAFELRNRLQDPANAGILTYWFELLILTPEWFERHLTASVRDLHERYHPEDHVEVQAGLVFDGLTRSDRLREDLLAAAHSVKRAHDELARRIAQINQLPADKERRSLNEHVESVYSIVYKIDEPAYAPWPIAEWRQRVLVTQQSLQKLNALVWDQASLREHLSAFSAEVRHLAGLLNGIQMSADNRRQTLIVGVSGTGKSHLLADTALKAKNQGLPAILLLGQHFRNDDPWTQILSRLDLSGYNRAQFLAALDASAETARTRGLFLIDGLNEGAGLRLWRDCLASFITDITAYPNLSIAVSCRSEYLEQLIPDTLRTELIEVECRGFETVEEQEAAARQYLEKNGITRPALPWLAPEFVNPLFLRSCCTALAREGQTEFPRGLHGTNLILAYYLGSIGRHLDPMYSGTDRLVRPTQDAMLSFAKRMAERQQDYLLLTEADEIAAGSFRSSGKPNNGTWLDVLAGAGLLRRDPNPDFDSKNPLEYKEEVVRFAFQRFSDHLIASALLEREHDIRPALKPGGAMAFLLAGAGISTDWLGVVNALAILVPEVLGFELVDVLPGGPKYWWSNWGIQAGFEQSLLWRAVDAFTERTAELFDQVGNYRGQADRLLRIRAHLAVVQDHPWNADQLDKHLRSFSMPDRDAGWSLPLAAATSDEAHPIKTLIDWAWRADKSKATSDTIRLTCLALTWCFTTSSRVIRDRATKALTKVLLVRTSLCQTLLEHFANIDDPYVLERLMAAIYGVACARPAANELREIAAATYENLFVNQPPLHLLTRDYALGVLEAASSRGVLSSAIDLKRCRGPFASDPPSMDITEVETHTAAEAAGSDCILRSCDSWGDFGCYEIEPAIRRFTTVRLSESAPLSKEGKLARFEELIVGHENRGRRKLFDNLRRQLSSMPLSIELKFVGPGDAGKRAKASVSRSADEKRQWRHISKLERAFLKTLTVPERQEYVNLAKPALFPSRIAEGIDRIPKTDLVGAQRWVARRAYELGWTKESFPDEPTEYSRERPLVERIGKKYQWIALFELLSRLADNFWLVDWSGTASIYGTPDQVEFLRDVDPTVFAYDASVSNEVDPVEAKAIVAPGFSEIGDSDLLAWPFCGEVLNSPSLLERDNDEDGDWLVLYDLIHADEKPPGPSFDLGFRRSYFTRVSAVIVRKDEMGAVLSSLRDKKLTDPTDWEPRDVVDEAFLLELPWRSIWQTIGLSNDSRGLLEHIEFAWPLMKYVWESHLDAALPSGLRIHVPAPWFMTQFKLHQNASAPSECRDFDGNVIKRSARQETRNYATVVRRKPFLDYLRENRLECLWIVAGERNASRGRPDEQWACRYHSAVYWWTPTGWNGAPWYEDVIRADNTGTATS